ncbi:MAG: wax ester/triacylglycerol synthase family O-acyltransferase [Thermoanaerobaculia bacterium]
MPEPLKTTEPLTGVDRAWLRMDHPTNLMMINGVMMLEEPVDHEEIKANLETRLLNIPRFRQRVVTKGRFGRHYWELDPAFDLAAHLDHVSLPEPGGDRELQELVSSLMSVPLDATRPLWNLHQVDNYRGGTALLWRLHHCIGDGIAMMLVLLSLTDLKSGRPTVGTGPGDEEEWEENPLRQLFSAGPLAADAARGHLERVMPTAVKLLTGPAETLRALSKWKKGGASVPAFGRLAARLPDPKTLFKGPLGVEKRAAWSDGLPLEEVQLVCRHFGGTVNDVLTSAVTGGLRRYLEGKGALAKGLNVRAVVPVSLRPLEEMATLGNQFGLAFLSLPVGLGDPVERFAELRRRMTPLKRSFEPYVALQILGAIGRLPRQAQNLVVRIFGAKGTAVMTNVPGPTEVLYMAGKPIRSFMFWVPQSGRMGMGIAFASYAGEVRLGIATDTGLVADPEKIVEGFHQEFDEMLQLARDVE